MHKKIHFKHYFLLPLLAITTASASATSLYPESAKNNLATYRVLDIDGLSTLSLNENSTIKKTAEKELLANLKQVKKHLSGKSTLTGPELDALREAIAKNNVLFADHFEVIESAFETIDLYESKDGGLFTEGTKSMGGYKRDASGFELENLMLVIMQAIMDNSYTEANLAAKPELFKNRLFKTSSYFPGAVEQPADPSKSYTIKINGTHVKKPGTPANYETEDARRPTGTYLAPGSVATVTVPSSLVGIGASVLVGAHTWDLTKKNVIKRLDRVTTKYDITSETITIANPLGGGIYINVPYKNDLGILNITLENVVRSPYYARTAANQTSLSDWKNVERLRDVPWTDIETDKVMMQVPTAWIYNFDGIETTMDDWDMAMDAISTLLGRPLTRSKTTIYMQVDVINRGKANFPGYPQSNVSYDPYTDYKGYHSSYLIDGPRDQRGYLTNVLFHEQGHAEKIYKFKGEIESMINFLWVAVHNKKFGVEINKAFEESFNGYGISHSIEEAAISWMITENFRSGNQMSSQTREMRQEFSYQPRGHAKYADLVRLLGWKSIEDFYANTSKMYDNGEINYSEPNRVNQIPTDDRILRMSQAAGYDLRPLIHFWGVHPNNFDNLAKDIQKDNLKKSTAIYDQLSFYKTIVPKDNDAFRAFGLEDFSAEKIKNATFYDHVSQSYYQGFLKKWWDGYGTSEAQATIDEIQAIIDLYFPDGRPEEYNSNCVDLTPISAEASASENPEHTLDGNTKTAWTTKADGEYIIYDLGALYDVCELKINFTDKRKNSNSFDIQVSRENQTYLEVMQGLSSNKTKDTFETYSISRKARYIKIITHGNENDKTNSISEVKFSVIK
ncbi:M60 family peptidase N-terminal accessory domain-containing protein [Formosa sp. 4Alg 33]|uniref:M60 family peptidase N-terminal accessory domain-containing protein n=1 Tax=Formosa sp. 4Alg 33 TaxID=3382189 RepID=UPI003D9C1F1D